MNSHTRSFWKVPLVSMSSALALTTSGCVGSTSEGARIEALEERSPMEMLAAQSEGWNQAQREVDLATLAMHQLIREDAEPRQLEAQQATLNDLRGWQMAEREAVDRAAEEVATSGSADDEARFAQVVDAVFLDEWHRGVGSSLFQRAQLHATGELRRAPGCADIVGDGLLENVFRALAADDRMGYVRALDAIDQSLACGTTMEALVAQAELVSAMDRVNARFGEDLERLARRTTFSQLLNVILLIHDRTKWTGDTTMMQWMREHRGELGEVLLEHSSVPHLAGVWLHHPATGELVQLANLCERRPTRDCVSATHLLDALTDPIRLGMGTCAAVEMITPELESGGGYFCRQGACERESSAQSMAEILASGVTQFGVRMEELAGRRCAGGGDRPESGMGGALGADMVSCVASLGRDQPREQLACMVGVASASSPLNVPQGDERGAPDVAGCGSAVAKGHGSGDTHHPPATSDHQETIERRRERLEELRRQREWEKIQRECPACTPMCGREGCNIACTPGGALVTAMMQCTSPEEVPTRTACDPTYCDPIEPDSNPVDLGRCFGVNATGSTVGSLACATTSCGPGFTSGFQNGRCQCISEDGMGTPHRDECATARCADGSEPIATGAGCSCSSLGGDGFRPPLDYGTGGGLYGPPRGPRP